jgi:hypothetical protein
MSRGGRANFCDSGQVQENFFCDIDLFCRRALNRTMNVLLLFMSVTGRFLGEGMRGAMLAGLILATAVVLGLAAPAALPEFSRVLVAGAVFLRAARGRNGAAPVDGDEPEFSA